MEKTGQAKRKFSREEVKKFAKRMLYMVIANIGYAVTLNLFLVGNNIAGGGLSGIGIVMTSIIDIPLGVFILLCNIPIFIWAAFVKDRKFMITTLICAVVYSLTTDLFSFLPTLTDNLLVASICGGALYGVFIVVMVKADCSTGGTDLLSKMLATKFKNITLGTMYMIVDGFVVLLSIIVFKSFEMGMYAAIVIAVYSYVSDYLIRGVNRASLFYIITDSDAEPLARVIMERMHRGVTLERGVGMYAHSEKNVLMVVLKPREVYKLKEIIKETDPLAFCVVTSASEVMGNGFSEIDYAKTKKDVALEDEIERKRLENSRQ